MEICFHRRDFPENDILEISGLGMQCAQCFSRWDPRIQSRISLSDLSGLLQMLLSKSCWAWGNLPASRGSEPGQGANNTWPPGKVCLLSAVSGDLRKARDASRKSLHCKIKAIQPASARCLASQGTCGAWQADWDGYAGYAGYAGSPPASAQGSAPSSAMLAPLLEHDDVGPLKSTSCNHYEMGKHHI